MGGELCLSLCVLNPFPGYNHMSSFLSIHISEFPMQGLGLCLKCELLSAICLCKYVLANIFGSLYFAIVLRC